MRGGGNSVHPIFGVTQKYFQQYTLSYELRMLGTYTIYSLTRQTDLKNWMEIRSKREAGKPHTRNEASKRRCCNYR